MSHLVQQLSAYYITLFQSRRERGKGEVEERGMKEDQEVTRPLKEKQEVEKQGEGGRSYCSSDTAAFEDLYKVTGKRLYWFWYLWLLIMLENWW